MNWKFKKDAEPQGSSNGFWYDLTDGGYVKPEELLEDEKQIEEVVKAIDLLESFEIALLNNDLLNVF